MIRQLKWKFVAVLMTLVTIVLLGALTMNFVASSVAIRQENIVALRKAADRSGDSYQRPWDQQGGTSLPYFTLDVWTTGRVYASWDGYYDLSTEDLAAVASAVLDQGQEMGTLEDMNLRYVCRQTALGWRITCADLSFETRIQQNLLRGSVLVGSGALLIFFVLSLLLSNWMVRPVERAWRQQRQFISDASHELKTPLTVILSSADMLQSGAGEADSRLRWMENIRAEGERMRRLVEDMLSLTRSEEAQEHRVLSRLDLSDLVDSCALTFETAAFERGVELVSDIAPDLHVVGDGDRMRQLVGILLDNAVKYCADGGRVELSLRREGRGSVLLRVSNPGAPIPAQERERIFDRFYRTDKSRGEKSGYGLGLAIAKGIVTAMKGRIWVDCPEGQVVFSVRMNEG